MPAVQYANGTIGRKMMRKVVAIVFFALLSFCQGIAHAVPVTLIEKGSYWQYSSPYPHDLWPDWNNEGYASMNWEDSSTWSFYKAPFGNWSTYYTFWKENVDIALVKEVEITDPLSGMLTLEVACDNGFIMFVNGTEVARANSEDDTYYWEYTLQIDSQYFHLGTNTVSVLLEDHGGWTFFDMKLAGNTLPVPEPSTLLLLGGGLVGLVVYRQTI